MPDAAAGTGAGRRSRPLPAATRRERVVTPDIVPLERSRLEEASRVLARAFHDDPAWTWILPSPRRRARTLPALFRTAIAVTMAGGRVDTTAGAVQGL
ncbi:MAG TPA: hypothetical protein VIU44_03135, partial [Gaiellaceae bacterium]